MPITTWLRYAWASPNSAIGLLGLPGARVARVDGVLELQGGLASWFLLRVLPRLGFAPAGIAAMTLGHVVWGASPADLTRTRAHERVHVRQYERWGPLFLPAYGLASAVLYLRGRDGYRENPFERAAYAEAGG